MNLQKIYAKKHKITRLILTHASRIPNKGRIPNKIFHVQTGRIPSWTYSKAAVHRGITVSVIYHTVASANAMFVRVSTKNMAPYRHLWPATVQNLIRLSVTVINKQCSPTSEINKAAMLIPRITGKVGIPTASNAVIFTFRLHVSGIQKSGKFTIFLMVKHCTSTVVIILPPLGINFTSK
jgi:hypothetical protein